MKFLSLVLVIGIIVGVPQSWALASNCMDTARVAQVTKTFELKSWNSTASGGKGDWVATTVDPCRLDVLESRIVSSMIFLQDFPASPSRSDDFDHNVTGVSPYAFFQSRIQTIYFDPANESACPADTMAYVLDPKSHSLHICPYAVDFSSLNLSSILMHESRHIDGFPHRVCEHGDLEGALACDDSYDEGGAYAVGLEFFVRTSRNAQINAAAREEARGEAVADFLNRFNQAPLSAMPGILLLNMEGVLTFFDGKTSLELRRNIPDTTLLTLRDLPTFFDTVSGEVKSFAVSTSLIETAGPFAAEFRAMSPQRKSTMVDVYYGQLTCFLFQTSVHCEYGNDSTDLTLPEGLKPTQFLVIKTGEDEFLSIVAADGRKFTLPNNVQLKTWKPSDIEIDSTPSVANFRAFSMLSDGQRFAVAIDGSLLTYSSAVERWIPQPNFFGKKFKRLLAPFYFAQRLEEL